LGGGCALEGSSLDRAARAVAEGIIAANNDLALDEVLRHYDEPAVLWPPGGQPVRGLHWIARRYEEAFAAARPELGLTIEASCALDGLATVEGRVRGRRIPRSGGAAEPIDDSFLMVLGRVRSGEWRIRHLIWSPNRRFAAP
jgi:ketosteroid isomerase-like protein